MSGVSGEGPLVAAAAAAPTGAGVYFFLDGERRLLYVGKASNLRRRLQQHAKEIPTHAASKYARVRSVAWEELADDHAAHCREADLIVAFQPAQNAAIAGARRWLYLSRQLARQQHGDLVYEATPDGGAAFCLTLVRDAG